MARCRRSILVSLTFLLAGRGAFCQAADLTPVWQKFRERQAAAGTARVSFTMGEMHSADWVARHGDAGSPQAGSGELVIPAQPALIELSGDRVRFESSLLSFTEGDRGETVPGVSAYDGKNQQYFSDRTGRPRGASHGAVKPMGDFDEWQNVAIQPLFYALRPLRREIFGPDPSPWRVEDRRAVIGGSECLVMSRRAWDASPDIRHLIRAYLDPSDDFVPLRVESEIDGRPSVRMDLKYEQTRPQAWVPSAWSSVWLTKGGKVDSEYRCQVEEVTLGEPIADDRFVISFPPGTEVIDGRPNGRGKISVVQPGGDLIPKRLATAKQTAGEWNSAWLIAAGAAVLLGAALVLRRRRAGVD